MEVSVREVLSGITTVRDMIKAVHDEDHCRRLLEAMVWPGNVNLTPRRQHSRQVRPD